MLTLGDLRYCDINMMYKKLEDELHPSNAEILALLCNLVEVVERLDQRVKELEKK